MAIWFFLPFVPIGGDLNADEKKFGLLATLPAYQAELLVRDAAGETASEAVRRTGRSESWVRVNLFRARQALCQRRQQFSLEAV